jgi:DNA-binding MarR family transcriptional regulator
MSKQGLNALLNELDEFGYLTRRAAPGDGRHRVLELTPRGLEFAAATKRILDDIESAIADRIGSRQLAQLKAATTEIEAMFPAQRTERVGRVRQ